MDDVALPEPRQALADERSDTHVAEAGSGRVIQLMAWRTRPPAHAQAGLLPSGPLAPQRQSRQPTA